MRVQYRTLFPLGYSDGHYSKNFRFPPFKRVGKTKTIKENFNIIHKCKCFKINKGKI